MRVAEVLRQKGSRTVTIRPDQSINQAVEALREHGFGALVVSADGEQIDGIISERDIVRALGLRSDLLDLQVADLMTAEVVTCSLSDQVEALMAQMTQFRIRHLPVVDEGRLCGLVSIGDVVKHRVSQLEDETRALQDYIHHGR
jgi:CBS domain-containing protein